MTGPVEVDPFAIEVPRDVIRVSGPEAISFLQGQLSQDIEALEVDAAAWSFLLQPQGKVDAWLRVTRLAPDALVLDVDGGWGDGVVERLERFKLRTKAEFERLPWRCIAIRGARVPTVPAVGTILGGVVLDAGWPGIEAIDILGEAPSPPQGVGLGSTDDYEALRIECGVPAMGRELTAATIPAESGVVERSVSFTKGCYTGQELVARIDSRGGNVPRRLFGLVVEGSTIPEVGSPVVVGEAEVGSVTSAAWSPRLSSPVALAYIKRSVETPATCRIATSVARIDELPLLRSPA